MSSWLEYGDHVDPIPSVIVVNTLTFAYGAFAMGMYWLFFFQWIFANINQGFILQRYYRFWRYMDVMGAWTILCNVYKPSITWYLIPTALVFFWHTRATSKDMFAFRVNVWHAWCCYTFYISSIYS